MAFEITELQRDPADRIFVHAYDVNSGTLAAGQHIRVQIGTAGNITTLMDEVVPAGKVWNDIRFQFQASEETV